MTANGSLIISTSNRMSRVVDRIRESSTTGAMRLCRGESKLDFASTPARRTSTTSSIRLQWRSDRVRYRPDDALRLAFSSFVGTSLTLAVDTLIGNRATITSSLATTLVGLAGWSLMFLASRESGPRGPGGPDWSNRLEIKFYRELQGPMRQEAESSCATG